MKRLLIHSLMALVFWFSILVAQSYSAGDLRNRVEQYVHRLYRNTNLQARVEWRAPLPEVHLSVLADSVVVSHPNGELPRGSAVFRVAFYHQGRVLRSLYLPTRVRVFARVLTLQEAVPKGEPIPPSQLKWEEREVTYLKGEPITEKNQVAGKIARRYLPAGTILSRDDIRAPYLVRRGEPVRVQCRRGAVTVVLEGIALQNGSKGDRVWVKNPMSRKRLQVKVVERQLAVLP